MGSSAMVLDPKPISEPPPSLPSSKSDYHYGGESSSDEDDLYSRLKSLQRQLEFIDIQEEYVKDEQKNLKRELLRAQEEVKRIQSVPLVIGQFMEMVDQNNGIVGSTTGSNYYVRILSTINRELLKPSASVALHRHSNALVDVLPPEADSSISLLSQSEKPDVTYNVSFLMIYFNWFWIMPLFVIELQNLGFYSYEFVQLGLVGKLIRGLCVGI
jgi:26S proteasome regulatory subunit T3